MRRKFFIISFVVLLISTFSVTTLLLYYFKAERLSFLDAQIRQTATALIDSKLFDLKTYAYKDADDMISEELGPDSVGKFFIIRNAEGQVLFQTQNIELMKDPLPQSPRWVTLTTPQHLIRAVNLDLPRITGRSMQVGIIVDSDFMSIANVNNRTLLMILVLFLVILIFTYFLSSFLFSPIRSLTTYFNDITKSFDQDSELPPLSPSLAKDQKRGPFLKSDEFQNLLDVLKTMVEKINLNRKFTRSWSFQMAHELKTPLTIVNRDLEIIQQQYQVSPELSQGVQKNIHKISQTITGFLSWAEVTNQKLTDNLYVVSLSETFKNQMFNWQKMAQDRLRIEPQSDFQVLCNPLHLEQVLNNLVENAVKYSTGPIEISFAHYVFTIKDQGPGIPQAVLQRLGSPFNRGLNSDNKRGVGLGLAWVKTICDLYHWDLTIQNTHGTEISVRFQEFVAE